jgi:hypothetical protein
MINLVLSNLSRSCVGDNAGSFAGDRGLATRVVTRLLQNPGDL